MARYLLDTNHVGAVLDDRSALRERLYHSLKSGHRIATCVPVLCELETGIHQTHRRDHNRRVLAVFLRRERSERIGALERGFSSPTCPLIIVVFRHSRRKGNDHAQAQTQPTATSREGPTTTA